MPKSYKSCPSFDKSLGNKRGYLAKCKNAVNCRRCKRCKQVPPEKLKLWAAETKLIV